jgi:hypothetical protein
MMTGTSVHANRRSDAFSLRVTACANRYMNYVVLIAPLHRSAFTDGGEGQATMAQLMLKPDWLLRKVP